MAQAKCLRHLNFYLYFENNKLGRVNRTFLEVYISLGMWSLAEIEMKKGLDKKSVAGAETMILGQTRAAGRTKASGAAQT